MGKASLGGGHVSSTEAATISPEVQREAGKSHGLCLSQTSYEDLIASHGDQGLQRYHTNLNLAYRHFSGEEKFGTSETVQNILTTRRSPNRPSWLLLLCPALLRQGRVQSMGTLRLASPNTRLSCSTKLQSALPQLLFVDIRLARKMFAGDVHIAIPYLACR